MGWWAFKWMSRPTRSSRWRRRVQYRWSREQFGYALPSELDFIIAAGENGTPQFAVEFDEHRLRTDPATIRGDTPDAC